MPGINLNVSNITYKKNFDNTFFETISTNRKND